MNATSVIRRKNFKAVARRASSVFQKWNFCLFEPPQTKTTLEIKFAQLCSSCFGMKPLGLALTSEKL